MTDFWRRYSDACRERGEKPSSISMANRIGVTKASISSWNTRGVLPSVEVIRPIADALNVSADYLTGRTDDMTDWTREEHEAAKPATPSSAEVTREVTGVSALYDQLDPVDQAKVEGIMQGMLMSDKYRGKKGMAG